MSNSIELSFVLHLSNFLPDRSPGKRGPKPISKFILVHQLFLKLKNNLRWKDLPNPTVSFNYFNEIQRRGLFKKYFNNLTSDFNNFRLDKSIVDSTDIESHKINNKVRYSGKYHNYCLKLGLQVSSDLIPISFVITNGSSSDSIVLDKIIASKGKLLPYELFLDKGFERYSRRRLLKSKNCQVRMEMQNDKNSKRGPKFKFTYEHKRLRGQIEKVVAWIKSFLAMKYNRFRKWSFIMAASIFVISYVAFIRIQKL